MKVHTYFLTAARVGLQALFFVLLPQACGIETAAIAYYVLSVSTFVNPIAALGSQFEAIRGSATARGLHVSVPPMLYGLCIAATASALFARAYGREHGLTVIALVFGYVVVNYVRAYVDALAQGSGRYNLSQLAYVAFWAAKTSAVAVGGASHGSFAYLALLELALSLPWIVVATIVILRELPRIVWRFKLMGNLGVAAATAARMAWMEGDKLLLAIGLSSGAYVQYSLAVRASSAGVAVVSAGLGVLTPRIVRARASELGALVQAGKPSAVVGTFAVSLGSLFVYFAYPGLSAAALIVLALGLLVCPLYLISHVYADYVFYRLGVGGRLRANLLGAVVTVGGAAVVCLGCPIWVSMAAVVLSLIAVWSFCRGQIQTAGGVK